MIQRPPPAPPRALPALAEGPASLPPSADGDEARVQAIDALLPQTQCRKCGFEGCLPYARALARGEAALNRCPPGGDAGIAALAALLGRPALPLDASCGEHRPWEVARVDESRCIGCTLCIQACPVDAIVGATRAMHTVVESECTGCELCLPPCPMDCIRLVPVEPAQEWTRAQAEAARARLHQRTQRAQRAQRDQDERLAAKARHKLEELEAGHSPELARLSQSELARRKAIVAQALERARRRRAAESPPADPA